MDTLIMLLCFSLALSVCYFIGRLMRPNKSAGAKAIGFIGLLFIGPLIYTLTFSSLLAVILGDKKIEQALLNFLFLGMLLSPFVIGFGVYTEKNNA